MQLICKNHDEPTTYVMTDEGMAEACVCDSNLRSILHQCGDSDEVGSLVGKSLTNLLKLSTVRSCMRQGMTILGHSEHGMNAFDFRVTKEDVQAAFSVVSLSIHCLKSFKVFLAFGIKKR